MINKFVIFILLVMMGIPTLGFSQRVDDDRYVGTPTERATYLADYLNTGLSLASDQYSKVYSLFLNVETQRDSDLNTYRDDSDFRRVFGQKLDDLDRNISTVLTSDQSTRYSSIKANMRNDLSRKYSTDHHSGNSSDDHRRGRGSDDDDHDDGHKRGRDRDRSHDDRRDDDSGHDDGHRRGRDR